MAFGIENQKASAVGVIGAVQVAVKKETLQSIIENFDPLIGRLEVLANRAEVCGDKITGANPQTDAKAESVPEPNHLIWAAQARVSRLSHVVNMLESGITRIENGIS